MLYEGTKYKIKKPGFVNTFVSGFDTGDIIVAIETSEEAWCVREKDYESGKTWLDYHIAIPYKIEEVVPCDEEPTIKKPVIKKKKIDWRKLLWVFR